MVAAKEWRLDRNPKYAKSLLRMSSKTSFGASGSTSWPRERFGSCWKVSEAKTASPMLFRRAGIDSRLYHSWSKEFLNAGKKRVAIDTARHATSTEVKELPK
jgi:hypothetical protein